MNLLALALLQSLSFGAPVDQSSVPAIAVAPRTAAVEAVVLVSTLDTQAQLVTAASVAATAGEYPTAWPRVFEDRATGKYYGARYYSSAQGRFTTADLPFADQHIGDPQSGNLYSYTRNNPLKYVDTDGREIETAWDLLNVGLGLKSFRDNVKAGNYGSAALDGLGVGFDSVAVVVPILPGGAGSVLKMIRAGDGLDDAVDLARSGDAVQVAEKAPVQANRASGKAAEAEVAAELVAEGKTILGSQVCCSTNKGRRFIDHLVEEPGGTLKAVEVKSGVQHATPRNGQKTPRSPQDGAPS